MSISSSKPEMHSDIQEFGPPPTRQQKTGAARIVESVGLGLTVLALLSSITIVGTAGDALGVYNKTTLGPEFPLSLWPREFDLRPTIALVTCGTIIMLSSIALLITSKVPAVRSFPSPYPTQLTPPDQKHPPHLNLNLLPRPNHLLHRRHRGNILLLRRQRVEDQLLPADLVVPVVGSRDGCHAALEYVVQGEQDGVVLDGYDDPVTSCRVGRCGLDGCRVWEEEGGDG